MYKIINSPPNDLLYNVTTNLSLSLRAKLFIVENGKHIIY